MKHTILLTACICFFYVVGAQQPAPVKLNLEHATVFLNGALLENTATLNVAQGDNEIVFTNIANTVNTQSIVINATNGVAVASSIFSTTYQPANTPSKLIGKMQDSIDMLGQKKVPINIKIAVIDDQLKLLQTDITETGDNKPAPSTDEVAQMIELIARKKETLLLERQKQVAQTQLIDIRIAALNTKIGDEGRKGAVAGGQLTVKLYAREATTSSVTIKYVVTNAGWSPAYDIWADDVKSPIRLYYKANIYQATGIKWDKVRLTLSTGNPQEGMQPPVITPWYLSLSAPPQPVVTEVTTTTTTTVAYKRPLIDKYKSNATLSRSEIKAQPTTSTDDFVALTPGIYQSRRGGDVSYDAGRQTGNAYIIDGVQQSGSMTNYVAVDNSGVNTTFDIDVPYSIPCDGQQHAVSVKEYQVPATFQYYSVPKMDRDAFLQAEITSWSDLSLMPGPTNIFYEGTYIGQGTIDPRTIKDTMYLSLGRDKKIVIKREQDKKLHALKKTSDNELETFNFNTTVRNSRKEPITILVNDQLPVSNDKDIVIEKAEGSSGSYDPVSGTVAWVVTLKPNETRKLTFGYSIKHPKERQLIGMR